MGSTIIFEIQNRYFDVTGMTWLQKVGFGSRKPQPISLQDNYLTAFSYPVWIACIFTLLSFSVAYFIVYLIYFKVAHMRHLLGPKLFWIDFLLLTFTGITEPKPIPWFPKLCVGKKIFTYPNYINYKIVTTKLKVSKLIQC